MGSCQTVIQGPTPNGGTYSILNWQDRHGRPITRKQAVRVEVLECREDGTILSRSQAIIEACQWKELSS